MNPHAYYIACSYGALALAIVWELWSLRRLRAAALRKVLDEQALEREPADDAPVLPEPGTVLPARQPGTS
ncbi:MAG: heme exporter protein CcmD [Burkholderiaceae bacterium]